MYIFISHSSKDADVYTVKREVFEETYENIRKD